MSVWQPVQLQMIEPRMPRHRTHINDQEYFSGADPLQIPDLLPTQFVPERLAPWHHRAEYPGAAVHFFLDDYRFEAAWANPPATLARLSEAEAVLTPDFSLYSEMPYPVLLWQVYRSRWLGCYWQSRGLVVIPTVEWADPWQPWMFAGLPKGSVLAVQVGKPAECDPDAWRAMEEMLEPALVVVYGFLPFEPSVPVREFPTFTTLNRMRLDASREASDGTR